LPGLTAIWEQPIFYSRKKDFAIEPWQLVVYSSLFIFYFAKF